MLCVNIWYFLRPCRVVWLNQCTTAHILYVPSFTPVQLPAHTLNPPEQNVRLSPLSLCLSLAPLARSFSVQPTYYVRNLNTCTCKHLKNCVCARGASCAMCRPLCMHLALRVRVALNLSEIWSGIHTHANILRCAVVGVCGEGVYVCACSYCKRKRRGVARARWSTR